MGLFQDVFAILTKRKIAVAPTVDSLADLVYAIEKRGIAGAVAGSVGHRVQALEVRAVDASVSNSAGWLLTQLWSQVNTYLASRADGTIYNQTLRDQIANNLNAAITSRASAADWTAALATKLNTNADVQVSQVAPAVWAAATRTLTAAPSVIKSIQHLDNIILTNGGTFTIASVTVAKSIIVQRGWGNSNNNNHRLNFVGSPTSTQLTALAVTNPITVSVSVVEFV